MGGLTGVDYAISGVYRWVYPQLFYSDDTGVVFINPKDRNVIRAGEHMAGDVFR